jgi:hypothetical protein
LGENECSNATLSAIAKIQRSRAPAIDWAQATILNSVVLTMGRT